MRIENQLLWIDTVINRTPAYNMMVVLKETGLKADVLRAWERRYGLPHPQRTAGGHRLYSDYDIATVKWLKNRQQEGLSIARAAQMWKDLVAAGENPLQAANPGPIHSAPAPSDEASIKSLRQQWLEGCLAFDAVKAESALNQAFALYPIEKACQAILQDGVRIIGEEWYHGRATVQQEHFATSLAIRRLDALISAGPQPSRPQTLLVGCPPGELHSFPALLLSLYLQRAGMKVVYLGADIPSDQLDAAISAIHPDLVVLVAQHLVSAASLSALSQVLRERTIPLAYGGLIFNQHPSLRARVAGHFLGESLEQAVEMVEHLITTRPILTPVHGELEYRELAQNFKSSHHLIEHDLTSTLIKDGMQSEVLEKMNIYLGARLSAALELGDPGLMESELDWIAGLLANHHPPEDHLVPYLAAYRRSTQLVLGEAGLAITRLIDDHLSQIKKSS